MPKNIALFPQSVVPEAQPPNLNFGQFSSTGRLGKAYSPFVAGGGREPASGAVGIDNLIATVMHTLLDIPQLRTVSGIPADVLRALTGSDPIPGLF